MGLHLIKNDLNIDFVGMRRISYGLSLLLILIGIVSLVAKGGPQYGIDFAGGATARIEFTQPISDESLKGALDGAKLPGLVVQRYGTDSTIYLVRISMMEENQTGVKEIITKTLEERLPGREFSIPRLEMVGPKVGADLRAKALEAMYYAILITAIYISGRFEHRWIAALLMAGTLAGGMFVLEMFSVDKVYLIFAACIITIALCWKLKLAYALGAIVSMLHDVLIVVGIFSLCNKEFDLTTIAALLSTVGFSLNDTIIVYDRIRENLFKNTDAPLSEVINKSINQTMSRTILTSGTTLLVVAALLIWGGDIIHDFSLVIFLGVLVGTASSIFVASPILLAFGDSVVSHAHLQQDTRPRDTDGRVAGQV